ncbi:hypothetical protein [Spirochaeta cellobiosiphila]|uniref:hypothetical protein n=1 Tax=Spirochaeta cellobiosiphila TaxID=504483 RepID=UPI0003FDCB84|nr:hypothetical protein [Spirochaeta cellobiosiphila]
MNTNETIVAQLNEWLSFLNEAGFKYLKSRNAYETNDKIKKKIILNVVTPDAGRNYSVAFYYGVVHKEVDTFISIIYNKEPNKYFNTMYQFSYNDNDSKDRKFKERNDWHFLKEDNFISFKSQITKYIKEHVLPQLDSWIDLLTIRSQLESEIKNNIIIKPYENIIGIDCVLKDHDHAKQYIESFISRNQEKAESYRKEALTFFELCLKSNLEIFEGIRLTTAST